MLDELFEDSGDSYETILMEMMNKKNIVMKTEIHKPVPLTKLEILADWLKAEGMKKPSIMIKKFNITHLEHMVSYQRKGRTELFGALTEGLKRQMSLSEKLTRPPD